MLNKEELLEVLKVIREISVDFAFENSSILNSKDGYQKMLNQFDSWFKENKYLKNKIEEILNSL